MIMIIISSLLLPPYHLFNFFADMLTRMDVSGIMTQRVGRRAEGMWIV